MTESELMGRVVCAMTDRDVIERLQQVTGVGRISLARQTAPGYKPYWEWKVTRDQDAIDLMMAIRPHMGERRRTRIEKILRDWPTLRADSGGGRRRGQPSPHRLLGGDDSAGAEE